MPALKHSILTGSLLISCLSPTATSLSPRSHLMQAQHELFGFSGLNLFNPFYLILILVAAVAIYFGVRYCWRSGSSQTQTHIVIRGNGQNGSRPLPTHEQQNGRKEERTIMPQTPAASHHIGGLGYQAPVVSHHTGAAPQLNIQTVHFRDWENGNIFASWKNNENCCICSQHLRNGQRPRVVIDCPQQHLFHPSCLQDHRERVVKFKGGNGLYKCPECKEKYSPTVELYCNACRGSKVRLPLSDIGTASGAISWEIIRQEYGDCCQHCRVV